MNKAFKEIALIEGLIAAAFLTPEDKLAGWCANTPMTEDNIFFIAETCRVLLSANRAEQRAAHTGTIAFGNRTLVFREGEPGLFLAYLNSPVNEAVLEWLFEQIDPLLASEGVRLDPPANAAA